MGRKFFILVAFCVVLFAAILAGYWDMLDSERLRAVREDAGGSVAALTDDARQAPPATRPAEPATAFQPPASNAGATASAETPVQPSAAAAALQKPRPGAASSASTADAGSPETRTGDAPPAGSLPSFDILRVEPDGSAVLAGRAAPDSEVRLTDGAKTIGRARTSPGGDFAIVLDEPLPAGDHQIRIEAGSGEGRTVSNEVAIVSVPSPGRGGELLAMVEAPNRPSRIISLPSAAEPSQTVASADPDANAMNEVGSISSAPVETPVSAVPDPATRAATPSGAAVANPSAFAVEAVEIENGTIYIAGRAPGTEPVRAYVDDKPVGEDKARTAGRFLVTARTDLAPGDHRIRIDMIGASGEVASRVEVPFAKPEGGAMSAIASADVPDASSPRTEAPPRDGQDAAVTIDESESAVIDATTGTAPETPPATTAPGRAAISDAPVDSAPNAVATVQQPALETVNTRVLIRRGDTLWRISRDTYGLGRRYTVIYLANGDQIRNPNRIYPGQVFRLPKDEARPAATATN